MYIRISPPSLFPANPSFCQHAPFHHAYERPSRLFSVFSSIHQPRVLDAMNREMNRGPMNHLSVTIIYYRTPKILVRQDVKKAESVRQDPEKAEPVRQDPEKAESVRQNPEKAEPVRQDIEKVDRHARECLSPRMPKLDSEINQSKNRLESLIALIKGSLDQYEEFPEVLQEARKLIEEALNLRSQQPKVGDDLEAVKAYTASVELLEQELKAELVNLQNKAKQLKTTRAMNLESALNDVQSAYNAFNSAFLELENKCGSLRDLAALLTVRQDFWQEHENSAIKMQDFTDFNAKTARERMLDRFLIRLVESQVEGVRNPKEVSLSYLDMLSCVSDNAFLAALVSEDSEQDDFPFTDLDIDEMRSDLSNILLDAEEEANLVFLESLDEMALNFSKFGYELIAAHCNEFVNEFREINDLLSLENIENYSKSLDDLFEEFGPQYQLFERLLEAEEAKQKCAENAADWIIEKAEHSPDEAHSILEAIKKDGLFMLEKNELTDSKKIEAYIEKLHAFNEATNARIN